MTKEEEEWIEYEAELAHGERKAEEEKEPSTIRDLSTLKDFSRFLVESLKSIPDQQEILLNQYLKCSSKMRETLSLNVEVYQRSQLAYAFNKYLEKYIKVDLITHFNDDCTDFAPPDYDDIEIKRNHRVPLLIKGWVFFKIKGVGLAVFVYFTGLHPHFQIYFNKKDRTIAKNLLNKIRTYMKDFNFLKGEKLKLNGGYWFNFLNYPKMDWDEIVLSPNVKDEIMLNLIFPLANKELCKKYNIPWRRGILLGGEPGTGKTKLTKILCNLLKDTTVIWVTAESISEACHVRALFNAARFLAPTLIVMEDIDFFGRDRAIERSPIIGELLNQLDGSAPNEGIFVLASSNRPGLLDKALANRPGRFDIKLEIKLPDLAARKELVKLFSKNKVLNDQISLDMIATQTEGFTGAHIQEAFVYAGLDSLRKGKLSIQQESLDKAIRRLRDKFKSKMVV